jgi:hypothetical protein
MESGPAPKKLKIADGSPLEKAPPKSVVSSTTSKATTSSSTLRATVKEKGEKFIGLVAQETTTFEDLFEEVARDGTKENKGEKEKGKKEKNYKEKRTEKPTFKSSEIPTKRRDGRSPSSLS